MCEIALEIARHPRDVAKILVFAVAARKTCEDSEDLGRPLGAEYSEGQAYRSFIEPGHRPPQSTVIVEESIGGLARYVHSCVLEERDEIVGGMTQYAVLRIDKADSGYSLTAGQPNEIGRVIIAQCPHRCCRR